VLSNAEIQRIIDTKKLTPVFDRTAGVKWIVWDNDQWVSYDDADTFKIKMDWANKLGLGGVSTYHHTFIGAASDYSHQSSGMGTRSR
jgi:chitinase